MIKVGDVYRLHIKFLDKYKYYRIEHIDGDTVHYRMRGDGRKYGEIRSCLMSEAIKGTGHMVKVNGRKSTRVVKDLVSRINAASMSCPDSITIEGMGDATTVATIDLDEHRWYVLGTVVYKVGEDFIGVRGVITIKSEEMGIDDVGITCEAFEMEQVPSVIYRRKPEGGK